jgi:hypothetical protein
MNPQFRKMKRAGHGLSPAPALSTTLAVKEQSIMGSPIVRDDAQKSKQVQQVGPLPIPPIPILSVEEAEEMLAKLPSHVRSKITVDDSGCWQWIGSKSSWGYGQVWVTGKRWVSHRFTYTTLVGEIPEGLVLDHLCRVAGCCNPKHLEPVTQTVNNLRGLAVAASAARGARVTHCPRGHEYTPENTILRKPPQGRTTQPRLCRECQRIAWKASAVRKAARIAAQLAGGGK